MAYCIVCVNKRVNYITNEMLKSRQDCVLERYTCDFDIPKRLTNCIVYPVMLSASLQIISFLHTVLYKENSSHIWGPTVSL